MNFNNSFSFPVAPAFAKCIAAACALDIFRRFPSMATVT
ncbi:hypothetical protein CSIRO_4196 [Bradyrhizobiaceae bacterium SG-6C]|nr:hypothetical protein CSIRO_4196 [Bradyrhizobiaceae bacterium SG-6C]